MKGFEYQAAHALHILTRLLFCENGLVQVRYEGAQDIDTMHGDGRQVFIQYKDTPEKEYDFASVQEILHGFMRDAIDACGNPPDAELLQKMQLEFLLVSSGVIKGTEMLRLIRGSFTPLLAKKLIKDFEYTDNPVVNSKDLLKFAKYVISNTNVRLSPQLEGQQNEQETLAFAKLAMFGVPLIHIQASMDSLKGLLTPPGNLFAGETALALVGLPDFHPASGRSSIRVLPSENTFHDVSSVEREFRDSGRVSWAAVHYGLDAKRDCSRDICDRLIAMGRKAAVVLVTGNSASGKSTVVRRVGWDLYRTGKALVFEVVEPQKLTHEAWSEVIRLGEIAHQPVIIVCDEVDAESAVLEQVRLQPQAKVIVLASAKHESVIANNFPVLISPYKLDAVSEEEFRRLADDLGLAHKAKPNKFSTLMRAGDMFALSLALRDSSLDNIADRTLQRVKQLIPGLCSAFLCLCACGVRDQGVPRRLLRRMTEKNEEWAQAEDEGLVFAEAGERYRSGHATLASAILRRTGVNPVDLKMQLLQEVDIANARERRFGLGLLKNGLKEQVTELTSFSKQLTSFAEGLANEGDYLDLARGLEVLDVLIDTGMTQLQDARAKLDAAMGPDKVRSGHDAVRFMIDVDDFKTAFPVVARVFAQPGVSFGRNAFMRWVSDRAIGHVALQREAVAINLQWLRIAGFPPSETTKLVDCIGNGNTNLPADTQAEFTEIMTDVLEAIPLPPPDTAVWELLYAVCGTIELRIRDEILISRLLDRLELHFDATQLAANLRLLKHVACAASVTCDDAGKERVFRFLVHALPEVPAKKMYRVYLALLRLLPDADKPTILAWKDRLRKVDLAKVAATVEEYMTALPAHLKPIS
ncbi:hypothetical protein K5D38_04020 [Pseudomonas cichorii]|nr:hypothetical protein [Pseudomonas cichorii]